MIHYNRLFFFDIETASTYSSFDEFVRLDPTGSKSFALKYDRAHAAGSKDWDGDVSTAYMKNSPLMAEYGTVVCFSYGLFDNDVFKLSSKCITDFGSEPEFMEFIRKILFKIHDRCLILSGHNIKGFDVPFIFKKMLKYGIEMPRIINTTGKKPWDVNMCDTSEILKSTGNVVVSLSDASYLFGLESPKGDISGSDVSSVYHSGDIQRIRKYCERDVVTVKDICVKLFDSLGETF